MTVGLPTLLAGGLVALLLTAGPVAATTVGSPYYPPSPPEPQPPPQSATSTLSVTRAGSGTGTVTSTPAGISCGSDCSEAYSQGTTVVLTATPDAGSTFTGWSGACAGVGTCSVPITGGASVTATFAAQSTSAQADSTVDASLTEARAERTARTRRVRVEITAAEPVSVVVSLLRAGAVLVEKSIASFAGDRAVTLTVPRGAAAGPAVVRVTIADAVGNEKTVTRRVRLAKR